jgi:hypothetical protein
MNKNLTDLTVVMDRSGSMHICQVEAEGGINAFVQKQKGLPGECTFSLVQFDTEYEFIYNGKSIKDVGKIDLVPRGMTALNDAIGRAINETGVRLKNIPEESRPGLVVFVIVTDGQENSSHEFSKAKIREMIELQRNTYQWQFTYIGANVDAFAEAAAMGITRDAAANFASANSADAYAGVHANVGRMRHAVAAGKTLANRYTDDERKKMAGDA